MNNLSRKTVLVLVAMFALVLASWTVSASAPAIEFPLDNEQYINTYLVANPSSLDISLRSDSYSNTVIINTMEGLIRMEEREGEYFQAPGDAYKWESNEDGTVWTFYLGDNKWEDGVPVTAHDYVYSLRRSSLPETGSPNSYFLAPLKNFAAVNAGEMPIEELGVKALDDKTLELTLNEPLPSFLSMIDATIYYPQRQDKVEEWGERYGSEAQYTISNGPFKLSRWVHNSVVEVVKNDQYWDTENVNLERVTWSIMPDETTYYNAFESGEIDFVGTGAQEWIDRFQRRNDVTYNSYTSATITYAFFNAQDELFQNANIRKAFMLAIDREDINEMAFGGLRVPTYGWVVPTISVGNTNYREAAGDIIQEMIDELKAEGKTAKDLLLQGMQELGLGNDPSSLRITFNLAGTDQWFRNLGEYLQQVYGYELGVNLQINFSEWGIFYDNVQKGNYQIGFMAWGAYYNDPYDVLSLFVSDYDMIETGWVNKEYDELIFKAAVEMDEAKRLDYYIQAENILLRDEAVASPLATSRVNQFVKNYVHNYATLGFSNMGFKYVYTSGR
ncbi:MAG: peptide ABC transporter substrate-binding protein [Firmicutes bacterium]|nr:peptide ABC transporter substrate-binding protein [Bacillota bacterium]